MDAERLDIEKTLSALTIEEKLCMLTGDDMWHTFGAAELPRVRMADGPCGLRMTEGASSSAVPSTLFPSPSMLANSWDPALLYNVGAAIGAEATAMGVNLLLAPGINIKRNPLGGRNFEYYSEDPYLSGTLGKAFVSGVQSTGVGACVKHFAANNSETLRMYSDSLVDPRALHELYLKPFEIALEAKPAAVMCAYNKLNGTYCAENEYLLKTTLRDNFGYEGLTVSDWGAVRDRAVSLAAGLDLEMPFNAFSYGFLSDALESGEITEEMIDDALRRLLELTDDIYLEPYGDFDADVHDKLAYFAAVDSVVLLKNDGNFLPLTKDMKIAVIGDYAASAPLQGGGSSHVAALRSVSPLEAFSHRGIDIAYYRGYSSDPKENAALLDEALRGAAEADAVVVYAGLPEPQEGADRRDLELPPEQNALISALVGEGRRIAVVLATPGPVAMPWVKRVRAVLYQGLCGANGSLASVDVLYGRVNPRGKLAESFADTADAADLGGLVSPYRESLFVGYRRYDRSGKAPLFPFGHGLSFSDINYDALRVKRLGDNKFDVTVTLSNASTRDAYETVQIYVSDRTGRVMRPEKQLAGYCKVFVEGETTAETVIRLDGRAFEFWNEKSGAFAVPDGEFKIIAAASASDIKAEVTVKVDGDFTGKIDFPASYSGDLENITDADFETLLGYAIPEARRPVKGEYSLDSSLSDIKKSLGGRIAVGAVKRRADKLPPFRREAFLANALDTPLSAVASMSDGAVTPETALGLVEMANGRFFKGLKLLIKKKHTER